MNIVFLDSHALNPGDLDWAALEVHGQLTVYGRTASADIAARAAGAEVVITNKKRIDADLFAALPQLKLVLVAATGYDVVDIDAARHHGVVVCNVPAYSTLAVAQHTLALLLECCNRVGHYTQLNREGYWSRSRDFCLWDEPIRSLEGKRTTIVGMGHIGKKVAQLLYILGAEVGAVTSQPQEQLPQGIQKLSLEEAFSASDVVSLHCPLTSSNRAFVNAALLKTAKRGLVLINTARGGLIDDIAVADALHNGCLGAYACDVLSQEPPSSEHPILHAPNTFITPHIAWASRETRQRVIDIMGENLRAFIEGRPIHVVTS